MYRSWRDESLHKGRFTEEVENTSLQQWNAHQCSVIRVFYVISSEAMILMKLDYLLTSFFSVSFTA